MSVSVMCAYLSGGNSGKSKETGTFQINSILPCELAQHLLKSDNPSLSINKESTKEHCFSKCVLLDCRPFLAYNFKHISGAFNVNCTGIGKKRLQQGKASLVDLVTCQYGKDLLNSGQWTKAVVYDDSTSELDNSPPSHPLRLVVSSLLDQGKDAVVLKGGLKEFAQCHRDLIALSGSSAVDVDSNAIDQINAIARKQEEIAPAKRDLSDPLNVRATRVLSFLFLGNAIDAADEAFLESENITYILNLTCSCPNYFVQNPKYRYLQLTIEDSSKENILAVLDRAVEFIDEAVARRAAVLVHCQAGVSRSPTVTIAYLMRARRLALRNAYDLVKSKRPCIAPNLNFMGQLQLLDEQSGLSDVGRW